MRQVYWGSRARYPRLLNINWLDVDMFTSKLVRPGSQRRRNDYRLLDVPAKRRVMDELLRAPGIHRSFASSQCRTCRVDALPWPRVVPTGLTGQPLRGTLDLEAAERVSRVTLQLGSTSIPVSQHLPYRFTLPATALKPGKHTCGSSVLKASC